MTIQSQAPVGEVIPFNDRLHYVHTLIDHYKENPSINNVLTKANLTAIDLGCWIPDFLFCLFHEQECFTKMIGIEQHYLETVLKATKSEAKSIYDHYLNWFSIQPADYASVRQKLSEEEFNQHFDFRFDSIIEEFLEGKEQTCDLCILGNILHLFNPNEWEKRVNIDALQMFEETSKRINKGGILYIRTNHQDNPSTVEGNHYRFNEDNFLPLLKDYEQIHFSVLSYPDKPFGKHALLFLGVKK